MKDGQIVENKVIEIDGKHYGFDYRGILYVNTNFYMYDTDGVEHYEYRAKEDGSLYENEWYRDSYDHTIGIIMEKMERHIQVFIQ